MYSLNILNINIISHILIHVSVISNNKKYEIKLLWERTNYKERESKLGWKGARKYLRGRRKLLEKGVLCKWGNNMYFQFISEEGDEGVRSIAPGGLAQHLYVCTCVTMPCAAPAPCTLCLYWPKVVVPLQL